ncbi:hypothetical protein L6452_37602 [Arctium lappa]|uniref:Uncharacterized protein n=1 Tax=Arctium lappa TaxID=4217 RepID=A0ACB8Y4G5_ARCLA|nr:hypothetical protein L6452_37602 [Arctium lappa]
MERKKMLDSNYTSLREEIRAADAQNAPSNDDDDDDDVLKAVQTVTAKVDHIEEQLEDHGYIRTYLTGERRKAQKRRQGSTSSSPRPE